MAGNSGLTPQRHVLEPSPSDRQGIVILLQYHLHKLYVLSIYHPARGFDLSSANITPVERHELLVSARAVLRLRQDDASIWSNWDLIVRPSLSFFFIAISKANLS